MACAKMGFAMGFAQPRPASALLNLKESHHEGLNYLLTFNAILKLAGCHCRQPIISSLIVSFRYPSPVE